MCNVGKGGNLVEEGEVKTTDKLTKKGQAGEK